MGAFNVVLLIVCILALLQPSEERFKASLVFVLLLATHHLTFGNADGFTYYPSAAIFHAMTIFLLCGMSGTLSKQLQVVALASFFGEGFGFFLWSSYLPLDVYESFFKAVYAFSILLLIGGEPHAWRHIRGFRLPWIWVSGRAAYRGSLGLMGKVESCETH